MYKVSYTGICCNDLGLYVSQRPDLPAAQRKYETIEIPGRDGKLYRDRKTYDDVEVSVSFGFLARNKDCWGDVWKNARMWLNGKSDKELYMSDMQDCYLKVKNVQIGTGARTAYILGSFDVTFVCEPFWYLYDGKKGIEIQPEGIQIINPGHTAKPVYEIAGEGLCEIVVNGKTVTANVGQNLTIDTDLQLAYRSGTVQNTRISGSYDDLWLTEGETTISHSGGLKVVVIPRWRYL